MGEVDRARGERDAAGAGGLMFPDRAGCAGSRAGGPPADGRAHPCPAAPVGTVKHRFERPRPHSERLFVCDAHAVGHPDPRPLTAADRAELRRRRRRLPGRP